MEIEFTNSAESQGVMSSWEDYVFSDEAITIAPELEANYHPQRRSPNKAQKPKTESLSQQQRNKRRGLGFRDESELEIYTLFHETDEDYIYQKRCFQHELLEDSSAAFRPYFSAFCLSQQMQESSFALEGLAHFYVCTYGMSSKPQCWKCCPELLEHKELIRHSDQLNFNADNYIDRDIKTLLPELQYWLNIAHEMHDFYQLLLHCEETSDIWARFIHRSLVWRATSPLQSRHANLMQQNYHENESALFDLGDQEQPFGFQQQSFLLSADVLKEMHNEGMSPNAQQLVRLFSLFFSFQNVQVQDLQKALVSLSHEDQLTGFRVLFFFVDYQIKFCLEHNNFLLFDHDGYKQEEMLVFNRIKTQLHHSSFFTRRKEQLSLAIDCASYSALGMIYVLSQDNNPLVNYLCEDILLKRSPFSLGASEDKRKMYADTILGILCSDMKTGWASYYCGLTPMQVSDRRKRFIGDVLASPKQKEVYDQTKIYENYLFQHGITFDRNVFNCSSTEEDKPYDFSLKRERDLPDVPLCGHPGSMELFYASLQFYINMERIQGTKQIGIESLPQDCLGGSIFGESKCDQLVSSRDQYPCQLKAWWQGVERCSFTPRISNTELRRQKRRVQQEQQESKEHITIDIFSELMSNPLSLTLLKSLCKMYEKLIDSLGLLEHYQMVVPLPSRGDRTAAHVMYYSLSVAQSLFVATQSLKPEPHFAFTHWEVTDRVLIVKFSLYTSHSVALLERIWNSTFGYSDTHKHAQDNIDISKLYAKRPRGNVYEVPFRPFSAVPEKGMTPALFTSCIKDTGWDVLALYLLHRLLRTDEFLQGFLECETIIMDSIKGKGDDKEKAKNLTDKPQKDFYRGHVNIFLAKGIYEAFGHMALTLCFPHLFSQHEESQKRDDIGLNSLDNQLSDDIVQLFALHCIDQRFHHVHIQKDFCLPSFRLFLFSLELFEQQRVAFVSCPQCGTNNLLFSPVLTEEMLQLQPCILCGHSLTTKGMTKRGTAGMMD